LNCPGSKRGGKTKSGRQREQKKKETNVGLVIECHAFSEGVKYRKDLLDHRGEAKRPPGVDI